MDATPRAGRISSAAQAVATVVYSARALLDIESTLSPWSGDTCSAAKATAAIRSGIDNLAAHPLIGRRVEGELRELIVSLGATGYVALYRFLIADDEVRVLTLVSQRELGFTP
jgi:plasmid stabilization system protein ParE